ncbi:MAG: peptidoglycan DD-metalloendopeptidase family protein [Clostridiaceae bacterium]|nr:peptidoglycan DD-metalloendopeptidase family protein [Clostridiaceae bacterium]
MRRKKKIILGISVWLAGAVLCMGWDICGQSGQKNPDMVQAGVLNTTEKKDTQDIDTKIRESNQQKKALEQEKEELEEDIQELEEKKDNIVEYIEQLDRKSENLTEKITQNKQDIALQKKKLKAIRKEKKASEAQKNNQYDIMKKRIKYLYENGTDSYFQLLFGADSLSEFFNRSEYISKISEYDSNMLNNYQKTCQELEEAETELRTGLSELEALRASLKLKKESLELLGDKKTQEMEEYQTLLQDKSAAADETENAIQEQEDALEELLEQQRAQQEEKEKKASDSKASAQDSENTTQSDSQTNQDSSENTAQSDSQTEQSSSDDTSQTTSSQGYVWPLAVSGTITSYFGYRVAPTEGASTYHKGIDISVPTGTKVLATKAGTVVTASYSASAGNYVAISHGNGVYSYYMHCSALSVSSGKKVSAGQQIALSGNTGISTGPHLHFAIYAGGTYVNPLNYVSQ